MRRLWVLPGEPVWPFGVAPNLYPRPLVVLPDEWRLAGGGLGMAENRRSDVVEMTAKGWSAAAIAERLGVSDRTVIRDRVAAGIRQPVSTRLTEDELRRAKALLEDGCSYKDAANTIGRSATAVQGNLPGYGWNRATANAFRNDRARLEAL